MAGEQVNQTGAFEAVAQQPFGKVLLVLMVLGLLALTVWRLMQAFVGDPVEGDEAKDRAKFVGKAVIYGVLTGTAIKVTIDAWTRRARPDGGAERRRPAAAADDVDAVRPAGRAADRRRHRAGAHRAGAVPRVAPRRAGVVHEAASRRRRTGRRRSRRLGRFGYAARSVVFLISGIFFLVAAVQYDPNESQGLSGSLQELAQHSWGRIVLWATALGLFCFGLFCLAESRYRRHT